SLAGGAVARAVRVAPASVGDRDGRAARPDRSAAGAQRPHRAGAARSHLGGALLDLLSPPALTRLGQPIDRVVELVLPRQRVGVVLRDAGAVVLGPEGDAALVVVLGHLVDPALADVGHVADEARGGEAGQVAHDVVLQLLGLGDAGPPVL